jgi:hypothetical protein
VTGPSLAALAEDPEWLIEPPDGSRRIEHVRYCVVIGPQERWASVCRLRLPDDPQALAGVVTEIGDLVEGIRPMTWNIGSSATPDDLPERLRGLGLRAPDPPLDAVCAAMVLDAEPPAGGKTVDVRRVETLQEYLQGLEIMLAAAHWSDAAAADARATATSTYERITRRGGLQWLASVDGEPVSYGMAERTPAGLFLAGGATLPRARGLGCYRALVRARWEEAGRLGTPGLAVQAQYGTSAPILRRLGFVETASVHTLQS